MFHALQNADQNNAVLCSLTVKRKRHDNRSIVVSPRNHTVAQCNPYIFLVVLMINPAYNCWDRVDVTHTLAFALVPHSLPSVRSFLLWKNSVVSNVRQWRQQTQCEAFSLLILRLNVSILYFGFILLYPVRDTWAIDSLIHVSYR